MNDEIRMTNDDRMTNDEVRMTNRGSSSLHDSSLLISSLPFKEMGNELIKSSEKLQARSFGRLGALRMTALDSLGSILSTFVIRHSSFFRHSSYVIRYFTALR
jgi:hypothetical protein